MKKLAIITTLGLMAISSAASAQMTGGEWSVRPTPPIVKAPTTPTPVVVPATK